MNNWWKISHTKVSPTNQKLCCNMLAMQMRKAIQIVLIHPNQNKNDESIFGVSAQNNPIVAVVDKVTAMYTVTLLSPR